MFRTANRVLQTIRRAVHAARRPTFTTRMATATVNFAYRPADQGPLARVWADLPVGAELRIAKVERGDRLEAVARVVGPGRTFRPIARQATTGELGGTGRVVDLTPRAVTTLVLLGLEAAIARARRLTGGAL